MSVDLDDVYRYLWRNLKVTLKDISEPSTCGGEVPGQLKARVEIRLKRPDDEEGEAVLIDWDEATLG